LLFIIYVNDLSPTVDTLSKPIIFADDTSVLTCSKYFDDFCTVPYIGLSHMSKSFTVNVLALDLDKINIMKFITNNMPQHASSIGYNGKYIEESVNMKFSGMLIDKHLTWTNRIDKLIPKLSGASYAVRSVFHVSKTDSEISVCCLLSFCNEVWNNFLKSKKLLTSQKKILG
jgi:hypothetical protein